MKILGPGRLAEVLSEWGHREASLGKPGAELPSPAESLGAVVDGVEVILRHIPKLIARILVAEPLDVLAVEFLPEEGEKLYLHNGEALTAYTDRVAVGDIPVQGALVCVMQVDRQNVSRQVSPVMIYDGWHRAAAWLTRVRAGCSDPIRAHLVKTAAIDPFRIGRT